MDSTADTPIRARSILGPLLWKFLICNCVYVLASPFLFYIIESSDFLRSLVVSASSLDLTFSFRRSYLIYQSASEWLDIFIFLCDCTVCIAASFLILRLYFVRHSWRQGNKSPRFLTISCFFAAVSLVDIWLGFSNSKGIYTISIRKPWGLNLFIANAIILMSGFSVGEAVDQIVGLIARPSPKQSQGFADVPETER